MQQAQENIVELPNEVFLKGITDLLEEGHTATLRVRGNSMRPFLEDRRDSIVLAHVTHVLNSSHTHQHRRCRAG